MYTLCGDIREAIRYKFSAMYFIEGYTPYNVPIRYITEDYDWDSIMHYSSKKEVEAHAQKDTQNNVFYPRSRVRTVNSNTSRIRKARQSMMWFG